MKMKQYTKEDLHESFRAGQRQAFAVELNRDTRLPGIRNEDEDVTFEVWHKLVFDVAKGK